MSRLVQDLRHFAEDEDGTVSSIDRRFRFAQTVTRRTVDDFRDRWDDVIDHVAAAGSVYGGLPLVPQVGLIPLGEDPDSGLEEFLHLQSHAGPMPRRNENDDLLVSETTGIIFVLLPGGTFEMGAVTAEHGGVRDPHARTNELPVQVVELEPFFMSKFEMTKAQWSVFGAKIPGPYGIGRDCGVGTVTLLHPVESISWADTDRLLTRLGLEFPTEAQWEYAARAGRRTVWWTGNRHETLSRAANVADQAVLRVEVPWKGAREWPENDDGYIIHAPVNLMKANPFGLHHVHGNVAEWCRDTPQSYEVEPEPGDGLRRGPINDFRSFRGGSFATGPSSGRCSARGHAEIDYISHTVGVRPSRRLSR